MRDLSVSTLYSPPFLSSLPHLLSLRRKDFKAESQLQQHLTSKVHKKKVQELDKKAAKKNKNNSKGKATNKTLALPEEEDLDDSEEEDEEIAEIAAAIEMNVAVAGGRDEEYRVTQQNLKGKQQNEEDDSEESDSEDDDSDDEENAVLDKLTQSFEKTTLDQPERSDSEDSEEGEGDVKERADVQNAVSSASVPGLTVPSKGTKKKSKGKKTKSSNQSGLLSLSSPAHLVSLLLSLPLLNAFRRICGHLSSGV
jgi:DnaJ homolog subfamily A member 5